MPPERLTKYMKNINEIKEFMSEPRTALDLAEFLDISRNSAYGIFRKLGAVPVGKVRQGMRGVCGVQYMIIREKYDHIPVDT